MKKSVQMVLSLSIVGIISGISLVGMYSYTHLRIEANKRRAIQEAIFTVLPGIKDYEVIIKDGKEIYKGLDSSGKMVGYAFTGEGGGYQGKIKIMVGVDPGLEKVKGIEILESVETPGLGAKISSDWFKNQFKELRTLPSIQLIKGKTHKKEPYQVQAITGATISSQAVVEIMNKTLEEVREKLKE